MPVCFVLPCLAFPSLALCCCCRLCNQVSADMQLVPHSVLVLQATCLAGGSCLHCTVDQLDHLQCTSATYLCVAWVAAVTGRLFVVVTWNLACSCGGYLNQCTVTNRSNTLLL